jgi:hypothetical protein
MVDLLSRDWKVDDMTSRESVILLCLISVIYVFIPLQDAEKTGWNITIVVTFMVQEKSRGQRLGYGISTFIAL